MTDDELKQLFTDMRRHFDVSAESMRQAVTLVAEAVSTVEDKLHREAAEIRTDVQRGFADTQAMSSSLT